MTKKKYFRKTVFSISLAGLMLFMIAGCGEEYTITINDTGNVTEVTASSREKIETVLTDAGITVGEQDEVSPALTERITEPVSIDIKRYAAVTVIDAKGEEHKVECLGGTVADAVKAAGITLGDGQILDTDADTYLSDGMTITVIQQASVTLTADGEVNTVFTDADTVGLFLAEQGIEVGENDRLTPAADAAIENGMEITLLRVEIKEETETEAIAYSSETQKSDSLESGKTQTKQAGVDGEKQITYSVTYVDGVEESREAISETVTKEPVTEIIIKGTKKAVQSTKKNTSSGSSSNKSSGGKTVVSEQYYDDCDGSGHGVKVITYSDGTTANVEY